MEGAGVRGAYLSQPISIGYLTGFHSDPHERLMALVVRPADATLIVPGLDEEAARATADGVEVRAWHDGQDPWTVVSEAFAASGSPGPVAVEKANLSLAAWERLRTVVNGSEPVDAGEQLRLLRARKAPWEQERLRRAAESAQRGNEKAVPALAASRGAVAASADDDPNIRVAGARGGFGPFVQWGS